MSTIMQGDAPGVHDSPPPPIRHGKLADAVLRLLDKDPAARAGAGELADVLHSIAAEPKSPPRVPVVRPRPGTHRLTGRAPGRSQPRAADAHLTGLGFEDAHKVILTVSTDTGVAMLLAMPNDQAARILASYPSDVCRDLLHGVAAAWPDKAGAMMRLLAPADAGRILTYLKPDTAASILATASPDDAARMIGYTGVRAAAKIIAKLPVDAASRGGGQPQGAVRAPGPQPM